MFINGIPTRRSGVLASDHQDASEATSIQILNITARH
jgi:hypothetical protein